MSVARQELASTSLPAQNLVLFAGGTDMALSSGLVSFPQFHYLSLFLVDWAAVSVF
jgi:hypothetical protein